MPTGTVSGIVVIDLDRKNGVDGWDSFKDLEAKHGQIEDTPVVITPSGGFHFWFRHPKGHKIATTAGQLAPGVDIRGDGGYVIVPPSRGYEWEASNIGSPAEMPRWLIEMTRKDAEIPKTNGTEFDPFKLHKLIHQVMGGENYHDALNRIAASYLARGMPREDVITTLQAMMLSHRIDGDSERWQARYDDIPRSVDTAIEKYGPDRYRSPRNCSSILYRYRG
jgi:hypothetical protein